MSDVSWSPERVELMLKLVPEGHSYSVIGARVSLLPGPPISRNAAIGKATRMGINFKHPHTYNKGPRKNVLAPRRKLQRRIAPTSEALAHAQMQREAFRAGPDLITPPDQRVELEALAESACRFPYGDGPFSFCGKPKVMGKPYCEGHCLRAFDPPQPRRRAPQTTETPAPTRVSAVVEAA